MQDAELDPQDGENAFLVKGLRDNDQVVTLSFIGRYFEPIICFVMKQYAVPREDAEEIALTAMRKVADGIDQFDPSRAKFSTWIFTIAKHLAIDYLRRQGRQSKGNGPSLSLEAVTGHYDGDGASSSSIPSNPALKNLFLRAFGSLGEDDRTVLCLAVQEWSYAEIGEVLDKSQDAVKIQAHRARKRLRDAVKDLADKEFVDISEADWDGLKHWKGQKEVEL